jgi:hypothetical protein
MHGVGFQQLGGGFGRLFLPGRSLAKHVSSYGDVWSGSHVAMSVCVSLWFAATWFSYFGFLVTVFGFAKRRGAATFNGFC